MRSQLGELNNLKEPFANKMNQSSPPCSPNLSWSPDIIFAELWIASAQKKITIWVRSPKVTPILNWITSVDFHFLIWNTGFSQKASKIEQEMASAQSGLYSCSCSDTHVWTARTSQAKPSPRSSLVWPPSWLSWAHTPREPPLWSSLAPCWALIDLSNVKAD